MAATLPRLSFSLDLDSSAICDYLIALIKSGLHQNPSLDHEFPELKTNFNIVDHNFQTKIGSVSLQISSQPDDQSSFNLTRLCNDFGMNENRASEADVSIDDTTQQTGDAFIGCCESGGNYGSNQHQEEIFIKEEIVSDAEEEFCADLDFSVCNGDVDNFVPECNISSVDRTPCNVKAKRYLFLFLFS